MFGFKFCAGIQTKVIIDKTRGEVSLLEQDTIENVPKPTKKKSFYATF